MASSQWPVGSGTWSVRSEETGTRIVLRNSQSRLGTVRRRHATGRSATGHWALGTGYWLLVTLFAVTVRAADPVVLRVAATPDTGVWIGQQVLLRVDVLAQDGWAQIKNVRDAEIPGAQVDIRMQAIDVRGVFVQAQETLSEG